MLEKGIPLFINVGVPFMGACKEMKDMWEEISNTFKEGKEVIVGHLNVMAVNSHQLKVRLGIRDLPSILLIRDGKM